MPFCPANQGQSNPLQCSHVPPPPPLSNRQSSHNGERRWPGATPALRNIHGAIKNPQLPPTQSVAFFFLFLLLILVPDLRLTTCLLLGEEDRQNILIPDRTFVFFEDQSTSAFAIFICIHSFLPPYTNTTTYTRSTTMGCWGILALAVIASSAGIGSAALGICYPTFWMEWRWLT